MGNQQSNDAAKHFFEQVPILGSIIKAATGDGISGGDVTGWSQLTSIVKSANANGQIDWSDPNSLKKALNKYKATHHAPAIQKIIDAAQSTLSGPQGPMITKEISHLVNGGSLSGASLSGGMLIPSSFGMTGESLPLMLMDKANQFMGENKGNIAMLSKLLHGGAVGDGNWQYPHTVSPFKFLEDQYQKMSPSQKAYHDKFMYDANRGQVSDAIGIYSPILGYDANGNPNKISHQIFPATKGSGIEEMDGEGIFTDISTFFTGKYPGEKQTREFLKNYGTNTITSMVIYKKPLAKLLDLVLQGFTLGKLDSAKKSLGYDKLFHLYVIVNGRFLIEKNEKVNMSTVLPSDLNKYTTPEDLGYQMSVPIAKQLSIAQMCETCEKKIGARHFFSYGAFDWNCQDFIWQLLDSNGLGSPELKAFIVQDSQAIASKLPKWVSPIADTLTDIAAHIQKLRGKGLDDEPALKALGSTTGTQELEGLRHMLLVRGPNGNVMVPISGGDLAHLNVRPIYPTMIDGQMTQSLQPMNDALRMGVNDQIQEIFNKLSGSSLHGASLHGGSEETPNIQLSDDHPLTKYGYAADKSEGSRHKALKKAHKEENLSWGTIVKMLNALYVLSKKKKSLRKIYKADREYAQEKNAK